MISDWLVKPKSPLSPTKVSPSVASRPGAHLERVESDGAWQLSRPGHTPLTIHFPYEADFDAVWEASGMLAIPSADTNANGSLVITAAGDRNPQAWDGNGRPLFEIPGNGAFIASTVLSRSGQLALFRIQMRGTTLEEGHNEYGIRLYDVKQRAWINSVLPLSRTESLLATSPDAEHVLIGAGTSVIRMETRSGGRFEIKAEHGGRVASARYDMTGRRFVTAAFDGRLRVWDAETMLPRSESCVFEQAPAPSDDEPGTAKPQPIFTDDGLSIIMMWDGWSDRGSAAGSHSWWQWQVSLGADRDDALALAMVAEALIGACVNHAGLVVHIPQRPVAELQRVVGERPVLRSFLESLISSIKGSANTGL